NGPVHLNFCFRIPLLEESIDSSSLAIEKSFLKWINSQSPKTLWRSNLNMSYRQDAKWLADKINTAKNPVFLIGQISSYEGSKNLRGLIKNSNIPVIADITSGIRFDHQILALP